MKVMVVGLGSMGKRRIRLLRMAYPDMEIVGVDTAKERRDGAVGEFGLVTYEGIEAAIEGSRPEAAIVCTAPLSHASVARACLLAGLNVFTELNLVADGYDELQSIASKGGLTLFLSSTLLYRKDIQWICDRTANAKVNYVYHVGQYLPDWHPWESYKSFFVKDERTNGCREILAIDLPWILRAFGKIDKYSVMKDKNSALDIDYPDNFLITFQHESGSKGVMLVDVISRKATRSLEVFSESMHIFWEGSPSTLFEYDISSKETRPVSTYDSVIKNVNYSSNIIENAYVDELMSFFGTIAGAAEPLHSFARDKEILGLIDGIEGR